MTRDSYKLHQELDDSEAEDEEEDEEEMEEDEVVRLSIGGTPAASSAAITWSSLLSITSKACCIST